MGIAITINSHWTDGKRQHVIGAVNFTGNYATGVGGVNLSSQFGLHLGIKSPTAPEWIMFQGFLGYMYVYRQTTGNLQIFTAYNTELGSVAYPEANIQFYAIFPKFVNINNVLSYWLGVGD
jgi:hypothetical protein